jgi:hypothetical protein
LLPAARTELTRRAVEMFKSKRATNRVIEEAMGFAAAKRKVNVPTTLYIEREGEEIEVSAVVEFELNDRNSADDWRISSAKDEHGDAVKLECEECDKACEQAHEKFCADKDAYL